MATTARSGCPFRASDPYPCSIQVVRCYIPLPHILVAYPSCLGGAGCGGRVCQEADKQDEVDGEEEDKEQDEETEPSDDDDDVGLKAGGWDIARHGKGQPLRLSPCRVVQCLAFPPSSGRRRTSPTGTAAAARRTRAATTPRMGGRESGSK